MNERMDVPVVMVAGLGRSIGAHLRSQQFSSFGCSPEIKETRTQSGIPREPRMEFPAASETETEAEAEAEAETNDGRTGKQRRGCAN